MRRQVAIPLPERDGQKGNFIRHTLAVIVNSGWLLKDRITDGEEFCVFVFETESDDVPELLSAWPFLTSEAEAI